MVRLDVILSLKRLRSFPTLTFKVLFNCFDFNVTTKAFLASSKIAVLNVLKNSYHTFDIKSPYLVSLLSRVSFTYHFYLFYKFCISINIRRCYLSKKDSNTRWAQCRSKASMEL